jgi:hypothetical protein
VPAAGQPLGYRLITCQGSAAMRDEGRAILPGADCQRSSSPRILDRRVRCGAHGRAAGCTGDSANIGHDLTALRIAAPFAGQRRGSGLAAIFTRILAAIHMRPAMRLLDAESRHQRVHRLEASKILSHGGGPGALSNCREAREGNAIEQPSVVELLAPRASLHTQQSSLDLLCPVAARVIGVAALQRDGASPSWPRDPTSRRTAPC